jgi:hypothetical protein
MREKAKNIQSENHVLSGTHDHVSNRHDRAARSDTRKLDFSYFSGLLSIPLSVKRLTLSN